MTKTPKNHPVLVTGSAGFIGSHVAIRVLSAGASVIGLDDLNDYYDVTLKKARLARFADHPNYTHVHADLADREAIEALFVEYKPGRVVHLAAQAGVRYAAENPHVYVKEQRHRHAAHPGRLPPPRRRASGIRLDQLGLRRQHRNAFLRTPSAPNIP